LITYIHDMKDSQSLSSAAILLFILTSLSLSAQISLVKDVNTTPASQREINDYSNYACGCGDYVFFPALSSKGSELWRTDGSEAGTFILKDINPGVSSGLLSPLFCNNSGSLFFTANDGVHGWQLWSSNGTSAGTKMVKFLATSLNANPPAIIGNIGQNVYFLFDTDDDKIFELWRSDGTDANTMKVANTTFDNYFNFYTNTKRTSTHIFFGSINRLTNVSELWSFDGFQLTKLTSAGYVFYSASAGSKIIFSTFNFTNGQSALWSSDGTVAGTSMIQDVGYSSISTMISFNDKVLFNLNSSTWISDGSIAGTKSLTNGILQAGTTIGSAFYGLQSADGDVLMKTDGTNIQVVQLTTSAGTILMKEIPVVNGNLIIQQYNPATGSELGIADPSLANFSIIKDIWPGTESSRSRGFYQHNGKTYFFADDGVNGTELWITDGTTVGTSLVKNIATGTSDSFFNYRSNYSLEVNQNRLHFVAATSGGINSPKSFYQSDGTASGTSLVQNLESSPLPPLTGKTANDLFFLDNAKLYKVNGTSPNVTLVKNLGSGFSPTKKASHSLGQKLIFQYSSFEPVSTGYEWWITDGTEGGTMIIKDINQGGLDGISGNGVVLDTKLIFDGRTPAEGNELWLTDGTEAGTLLIKDINSGSGDSKPLSFVSFKNKIYFTAIDGTHGREPWISDGTSGGTILLADVVPGSTGSDAANFTPLKDFLFFSAYNSDRGWCLWKTDGTSTGTVFVKDLDPGKDVRNVPTNFTSTSNKLYFVVNDAEHGKEIWASDGTAEGTKVIDLAAGPLGSNPTVLTPINDVLYFNALASWWRTNGTDSGTEKIGDYEPIEIVLLNNWIYFTAPHPDYGIELFKVEFKKRDQQVTLNNITPKVMGDAPFIIAASATSGLPVTIKVEEELTISGLTATLVKPGTVKVTAEQGGDALFNAGTASQTFCVNPSKPTIAISKEETGFPLLTSSAPAGNQWYSQTVVINGETQKTFAPTETGTYKVNVTIDGCVSEFSADQLAIITGIEETSDEIIFYPNPVKDKITFAGYASSSTTLNIMDSKGNCVDKLVVDKNETLQHSVSHYSEGLYIVIIVNDQARSYAKFVKE
jgi:ELWxxDGT repeat protein